MYLALMEAWSRSVFEPREHGLAEAFLNTLRDLGAIEPAPVQVS